MKEQALEHIRKSKDGFLELPQTILTKDIENAGKYLKFSIVHKR